MYENEYLTRLRSHADAEVLPEFQGEYPITKVEEGPHGAVITLSQGSLSTGSEFYIKNGYIYVDTWSFGCMRFRYRGTDVWGAAEFIDQHAWGRYLEEKYHCGNNPVRSPYAYDGQLAAHDILAWWDHEAAAHKERLDDLEEGEELDEEEELYTPDWFELWHAIDSEDMLYAYLNEYDPEMLTESPRYGCKVIKPVAFAVHIAREIVRQKEEFSSK